MSSERDLAGLEDGLGDWCRAVQVAKGVPDTEGAGGERCRGEATDWELRGHGSHHSPWSRRCYTGASFRPEVGGGALRAGHAGPSDTQVSCFPGAQLCM